MGTGGRSGFFGGATRPGKLTKLVRDSQAQVTDEAYEAEVSGLLSGLLADYNDRNVEVTKTHLDTIMGAIRRDIEGSVDVVFSGSIAKHTYVDGLSDVDALVILNKSELRDMTPDQVKDYFTETLQERLPDTPIRKGVLAVTVEFTDAEIQLLPALKHSGGLRIPDASGKGWLSIRPQEFTAGLQRLNRELGQKIVPTIKLAKAIIGNLPESRRLTGYHTEALAIRVFRYYKGPLTPKEMVRHFFERAAEAIREPIREVTGQSPYVDEYLGGKGSRERTMVADALSRIARRIRNADSGHVVEFWRELFE
jgi:hypothetical protein